MFAFQRALTLFFQFQTIFECFTNTLRHLVIPMSVRIKGDGVYQRHIKLAVFHNAFIRSDIDDLSNHSTAIFAILIFNKFTFETKWELVDNRGVYHWALLTVRPLRVNLSAVLFPDSTPK